MTTKARPKIFTHMQFKAIATQYPHYSSQVERNGTAGNLAEEAAKMPSLDLIPAAICKRST